MKTMRSSTEAAMNIMPTAAEEDEREVFAAVVEGAFEVVEGAEEADEDDGGDEESRRRR